MPALDVLVSDSPTRGDALVDGDIRLTPHDVDGLTACLAGGLRAVGVGHGDVVAWQLNNGYEALLLFRACWRLGAIAAPIHPKLDASDVEQLLTRLEPALIVGAAHLALGHHGDAYVVGGPSLPARRKRASNIDVSQNIDVHNDDSAHPHGTGRWFARLLGADPAPQCKDASPDDVAVVLLTAGSTGTPKAVLHTHETLGYKARLLVALHALSPADTVLMSTPLAHISGVLNGVLVPGVAGMKTVLMPKWNPSIALSRIEHERVTFIAGPPELFVGLMDDPDFSEHRVRSVEQVSTEGPGVTERFVERATRSLGALVKRSYGSTEVPTVATSWPDDDPVFVREFDGRACGEVELRVVEPSTGEDLHAGELGELWVRGPEMFVGYLSEPATHEAVTLDGWFRTRDLAVIDEAGWLKVAGRRQN